MADEAGGDVNVRLSQEGGDEIIAKLQEIIGKLGDLTEEAKKTGEQQEKLGDSMKKVADATGITAISTAATAVMEFGEMAWRAAEKVMHYVEILVEARAEHEQFEIKLAALDEKMLGWSGAMEKATENIEALGRQSSNADLASLTSVFQRLTLMVGGTDSQLLDLTHRMEMFGEKSGVTAEQLLRVVQMAERTGTLPMRGMMAVPSMALMNAGITGQDIKAAAMEGTEALQKLLDKIQVSAEATATLEGSWKNLEAGFGRAKESTLALMGEAMDPLKDVLKSITEFLNSATFRDALSGWVKAFKEGLEDIGSTARKLMVDFQYFNTSLSLALRLVTGSISYKEFREQADEATGGFKEFMAENQRQFSLKDAAKTSATWGYGPLNLPNVLDTDAAADPYHERVLDNQKQIQAATDALDKLYEHADQKHELSGLTGLNLKLAEITNQADAADEQMTKAYNKAIDAGWKPTAADSAKFDREQARLFTDAATKQTQERSDAVTKEMKANEAAHEKSLKTREAAEQGYTAIIDQMEKKSSDDVIEIMRATTEATIDQMAKRVEKEKEALDKAYVQSGGGQDIAEYQRVIDKKETLDVAFQKFKEDVRAKEAQKEKELSDLQTGQWSAYYDDLMRKAALAHQNLFVAAQENGKKVAADMEKQAQTGADGWNAGLAKIRAGITSFGQDVSTTMGAVWGQLTTAFDTGFYDILSGKFNDLGNVLRNLWDSVLKDFSKMLAQMLERWLLTGEAMGNGQGGGGLLGSLKGLLGGDNAVYTPGGTSAAGSYGQPDEFGNAAFEGGGTAAGAGGGGGLGTAGTVGAIGAYAFSAYQAISSIFKPHETSTPTYQGQSLGQTADFGGPGGGQAFTAAATAAAVAAGVTLLTATAMTSAAVIAAASATVPVIGWIVAAVALIIGAILTIFSGPKEGHVNVAVADAFQKGAGQTVIGHFVEQIIDSTANFVGEMALKAAGPGSVAKYVTAYNDAFKKAYGTAVFDIAAGSKDDLQKDVQNFFDNVLPKMAMQAAFGQFGVGMPLGDRDWAGGAAGLDWNTKNGLMDAAGNFIKKQLFDPNAPIPLLLAGIGFTQDAIGEIATKLSTSTDMKVFKQWLSDLVNVVLGLEDLAKQFGRSTQAWFDFIHKTQAEQGTAAQFTDAIANLKGQGQLLESTFGDDRVAAAKQLVTDSGTLLNNMGQALASILSMMDAIKATTASTEQAYREKLMTPADREAAARAAYGPDMAAIASAANPKDVQAAWQQVMKDLSTVLDAIVARIQTIKALQQSYADFRTAMADAAGPQFATDPAGWLAKNQQAINSIDWSDPVKGAQTLFDLEKQRFSNLSSALQKIDSITKSIDQASQSSIDNLRMQGMGSVIGGKWTPDVHAQGEFLNQRYNDLMTQLGTATSPDQIASIMSQINSVISQLASQPQDPQNYAESRRVLIKMQEDAQKAADKLLGTMHDAVTTELGKIGKALTAGETALTTALDKAQTDFTHELGLMDTASAAATKALQKFADDLTMAMNELVKAINHWTWVMTHPADQQDPNWNYELNQPKPPGYRHGGPTSAPPGPWEQDPNDPTQDRRLMPDGTYQYRPKADGTRGPDNPYRSAPPIVVNVNVQSGSPEEIAAAAAAAVHPAVYAAVASNNRNLLRIVRNNPQLISSEF